MSADEPLDALNSVAEDVLTRLREVALRQPSDGDDLAVEHERAVALQERLADAARLAAAYRERVEGANAAQRRRNRFTPAGVEATVSVLIDSAQRDPELARVQLFSEVAAAVRVLAFDNALTLLRRTSSALSSVPTETLDDLEAWRSGDAQRGLAAVQTLAHTVATAGRARGDTVAELEFIEAWLHLKLGDPATARETLDRLVARQPTDAGLHAERSALLALLGSPGAALDEAHRAIELDPRDARGYLQAGTVAEDTGRYAEAAELYLEAARRQVVPDVHPLSSATFIRRTGLFHLQRAGMLRDQGSLREALEAVDSALAAGIVGPVTYPDADARELRWLLLTELESPTTEVAAAALDAGKHLLWNEQLDRAHAALKAAATAPNDLPVAGWYLADCLLRLALKDPRRHVEAEAVWDGWLRTSGPPASTAAWAYAVRAIIGELAASYGGGGYAAAAWRGLLLAEKGLVLDPRDLSSWMILSRFYHQLSLLQLAREASDSAFHVNADSQEMLGERVKVLADAGSYQEALESVDRVSGLERDAWLSAVKAELLKRLGHPEQAMEWLSVAPTDPLERGWWRYVRAECLVDLGRLQEGVDEFRTMLAEEGRPASGSGVLRHAYALGALGRPAEARARLDEVDGDETLDYNGLVLVRSCVALAEQDPGEAFDLITRLLPATPDPVSVPGTLRSVERAIALLGQIGLTVPEGEAMMKRARRAVVSSVGQAPDGDAELGRALANAALDPSARTALLAGKARRLAEGADHAAAAAVYEQLLGSPFDPETKAALIRELRHEYEDAVALGDLNRTRALFLKLSELGGPPAGHPDVAVARALRQGGEYEEAVGLLTGVAATLGEPEERLEALELLGESALFARQRDVAGPALAEAFDLAVANKQHARAAQIAVRLAVWQAVSGRHASADDSFTRALQEWENSGAYDPRSLLRHEVTWLAEMLPRELSKLVAELLRPASEEPPASG